MKYSGSDNDANTTWVVNVSKTDILPVRCLRALVAALFPTKCLTCGLLFKKNDDPVAPVTHKQKWERAAFAVDKHRIFETLMASLICPTCISGFIPVISPICPTCGVMFKSREDEDHICGDCMTSVKYFQMARSVGIYDHVLMSIIHQLKYNGKIQLAKPLGKLLFAAFVHFWETGSIDVILPVPLHHGRFRKRGFNQAYLLIKDWPQLSRADQGESSVWQIEKEVLKRVQSTPAQTGLNRRQRLINIKQAFGVNDGSSIQDKAVLLVDDVYTTGATATECAKILLKNGAACVDVLTLARTL